MILALILPILGCITGCFFGCSITVDSISNLDSVFSDQIEPFSNIEDSDHLSKSWDSVNSNFRFDESQSYLSSN